MVSMARSDGSKVLSIEQLIIRMGVADTGFTAGMQSFLNKLGNERVEQGFCGRDRPVLGVEIFK